MNPAHSPVLWLRVAAEPAALERVLRQLRARLGGSPELALARGGDDAHELRVSLGAEARPEQVRAELLTLRDVKEARLLPTGDRAPGREMALVRLNGPESPAGEERDARIRVVSRDADGIVVEVTGTSPDLDRLLSEWRDAGRVLGTSRTGEVVLPRGPKSGPGTDPA